MATLICLMKIGTATEWGDIRVFLQVVRAGTVVSETSVLRMDHSTISRRISRPDETQVERDRALFRSPPADQL